MVRREINRLFVSQISNSFFTLIQRMLEPNPESRINAHDALEMKFFSEYDTRHISLIKEVENSVDGFSIHTIKNINKYFGKTDYLIAIPLARESTPQQKLVEKEIQDKCKCLFMGDDSRNYALSIVRYCHSKIEIPLDDNLGRACILLACYFGEHLSFINTIIKIFSQKMDSMDKYISEVVFMIDHKFPS